MDNIIDRLTRERIKEPHEPIWKDAIEEIERLRAENAELNSYAERYRWLRTGGNDVIGVGVFDENLQYFCFTSLYQELDDVIDKAMKEQS